MVQEMLVSDNSPMSPARISFSYDLRPQSDVVQPQTPISPSSVSVDFDFLVRKSFGQDSPTADELFAGGKILPAEIRKTHKPKSPDHPTLPPPAATIPAKQSNDETEEKEKQNGRSFWRFKRSSSVNCSGSYGPGLCPLPLLSRSHSTGSAGGSKRSTQKPGSGSFQKPPLKKSYGGGQVNGLRVNPVINIFGMGSIFSGSHGRVDKSKIVKK